jgi:uncharacterized protein (TIGR03435 family)
MRTFLNGAAFVALGGLLGAPMLAREQAGATEHGSDVRFEIADVHASPLRPDGRPRVLEGGGSVRGGRYEIFNATLVDLISAAYAVEAESIAGGPSWLAEDRFDVIAKTDDRTTSEPFPQMLRTLLADRFKLIVSSDRRSSPVWVLSQGGIPPKLKPAADSRGPGCRPIDELQRLSCRHVSLDAFVAWLRSAPRLTRPIVNATDLAGEWDFDLNGVPPEFMRGLSENSPMLNAVERQLGLTLTLRAMAQPVIVINHVERIPTPNPSDIEARLPADAVTFDVASIKPCDAVEPGAWRASPSGQIRIGCDTLRSLIVRAWNLGAQRDLSNGFRELAFGETPIDGPRWITTKRYAVIANAPVGIEGVTDVKLRAMLRNLLTTRFGMQARYELRNNDAYTLESATPKLKKADPSSRSGCTSGGMTPSRSDSGVPGFAQTITCKNATIAQFVDALNKTLAIASTRRRVVDETHLDGTWDMSFTYRYVAAAPAEGTGAAEPASVSVPIDEAIEQQLGLKLKEAKRPLPVLVIDRILEDPTEN